MCPKGTAVNLAGRNCTGCVEGCLECSQKDNSICLNCAQGLAILDSLCYAECPEKY